jgi:putative NADPH-quinone reductase
MLTAGASYAQLAKRKYDEALHTQINVGIWNYCSFRDVTPRVFECVNDDSPRELMERYLVEAESLARKLFVD